MSCSDDHADELSPRHRLLAHIAPELRAALMDSREALALIDCVLDPGTSERWGQPAARVAAFWAERLGEATEVSLGAVQAIDLWLACACVHGERDALDHFIREYSPTIHRAVASLGLPREEVEDIGQDILHVLLVEDAGGRRIAGFGCRGSLRGWIRTFAIRTAQARRRQFSRRTRHLSRTTELRELAGLPVDVERDLARRESGALLTRTLQDVFKTLSGQEREALRSRFYDDESIEAIAANVGVHRATVARWIATAREKLYKRSLDHFLRKERLDRAAVEALLGDLDDVVHLELEPANARCEAGDD